MKIALSVALAVMVAVAVLSASSYRNDRRHWTDSTTVLKDHIGELFARRAQDSVVLAALARVADSLEVESEALGTAMARFRTRLTGERRARIAAQGDYERLRGMLGAGEGADSATLDDLLGAADLALLAGQAETATCTAALGTCEERVEVERELVRLADRAAEIWHMQADSAVFDLGRARARLSEAARLINPPLLTRFTRDPLAKLLGVGVGLGLCAAIR